MCNVYAAIYAAGAITSAYGAFEQNNVQAAQYEADAEQYEYDAEIYDEKARIAYVESSLSEAQGMDALKVGQVTARKAKIIGKQVKASQRAGYAASGVRVDTGIAADITEETENMAFADSVTIRAESAKEAYGYRLNAWSQRGEARTYEMSAEQARTAAENSRVAADRIRGMSWIALIGSGMSSYSNYRSSEAAD